MIALAEGPGNVTEKALADLGGLELRDDQRDAFLGADAAKVFRLPA